MSSLGEDLALERLAVAALESEASALWRAGDYSLARRRRAEAVKARERVAELEMSGFDVHAGGQLRLAVAGEQVSLLPLPDELIPASGELQAVDGLGEAAS